MDTSSEIEINLDKIKKILKKYFLEQNDPYKKYNDKKIREIMFKNRYIPFKKPEILNVKTIVVKKRK